MPLNRRLIYASLTPYGEHGPERDRTAYDTTAWWARSGLMDMVRATGETEQGLSMPGMGDHPTALATYGAILTALYRRQSTGQGGEVGASLLANGLWSNSCQIQAALCGIELPPRGPRGERGSLTEVYETADGRHFVLAIANPGREWPLLTRILDREDWLDDPRFATPAARFENAARLTLLLDEIFIARPWSHWLARLGEANITFGIVGRITDHAEDPQVVANALLPEFVDGDGLKTVDSPFHVVGETKRGPYMAPGIGQHTRAVLEEFGLSAAEIATLTESE
jgi:crotonobetainyl-CoA:carnitine CoA-transferase CaiB-like acyl-CoA transferase